MDLNLKDKNAFVGGSSKGIGKATAVELALLGANVTLASRNEESLQKALKELDASQGQQHDYLVIDNSKPETLKAIITHHLKQTKKIFHILVNNTGGPPGGPAIDAQPEEFLQALNSHLICNQILTQAFVEGMKNAGYGRIINIISTSVKAPIKGLGVSNTTRGAVANWSKTLSFELGPFGITVNNVLPGATFTGRLESIIDNVAEKTGETTANIEAKMKKEIPLNRFASPSEVGAVAAFLATPAAGYISGINVPVDGGRTHSL